MDDKFKKFGIFGFILYILSLPILIWRSSNIGKVVFIFLIGLIFLSFSSKFADNCVKYYAMYRGVEYRVEKKHQYEDQYARISARFLEINDLLNNTKSSLEFRNEVLDKKAQEILNNSLSEFKNKINADDIDNRIKQIEISLSLLKEEQRQVLKEKIIEIKESVKINNKLLDSVEIRSVLEKIADNISLLNEDEKTRMMKDLTDIRFNLNGLNKQMDKEYYQYTTSDTLVYSNAQGFHQFNTGDK